MEVEITNGHIDVVSGIVYSQITTSRENRTLKMTLLIPQTDEPKPAIVFVQVEVLHLLRTKDILR